MLDGAHLLLLSQQFLGEQDHPVRLESKLLLERLKRCGGAERLHADDAALCPDVSLPAEG